MYALVPKAMHRVWNAVSSQWERAYTERGHADLRGSLGWVTDHSGLDFVVFLPEGYHGSTARYPVLYHLHGATLRRSWLPLDVEAVALQHEAAVARGEAQPMIIVAPFDPSGVSMWSDSHDGSVPRGSDVCEGLVPYVDATLRTLARRPDRLVQGFSMGGYGALMLALKRQDLFAAALSWDGALHDWRTLRARRVGIARRQFGFSEPHFRQWSPWALAVRADLSRTPMLLVSGALADFSERYTRHIEQLGGTCIRHAAPVGHDLFAALDHLGPRAMRFIEQVRSTSNLFCHSFFHPSTQVLK